MKEHKTKDFPDLLPDAEKATRHLSFKAIWDYLTCPGCFFGQRVRHELDKPQERDVLNIGTFLSGVIASAHTPKKRGLKFDNTRSFIGFANFRYVDTLFGSEKRATEKFLDSFSKKQRETINHILAGYFADNRETKVLSGEKTVKGLLGGYLVWGRIDQLREEKDLAGNKVIDVVEMKFNQTPNIQNCFQVGIYTALLRKDPTIQLPLRQIIYDLLGRRRFILSSQNPNLIEEIVAMVGGAIEAGYDQRDNEHIHYPQKRKIGGIEGARTQFPGWEETTRPPNWHSGQNLHERAKEKLREYFKTVKSR